MRRGRVTVLKITFLQIKQKIIIATKEAEIIRRIRTTKSLNR
jgi:hypothetical protein